MTKEQFFRQLEEKLRSLPEQEKRNIIGVYEDLFQKAKENGKSEDDVVRSLGYSRLHGSISSPHASQGVITAPMYSGLKAIIASLALGLFNLIFVLSPFIGISAVIFALSVCALVLTTSPLWIVIGSGIPDTMPVLLLELFASCACFGIGVLLLLGLTYIWKGYFRASKAYVRLNIRLIKGE